MKILNPYINHYYATKRHNNVLIIEPYIFEDDSRIYTNFLIGIGITFIIFLTDFVWNLYFDPNVILITITSIVAFIAIFYLIHLIGINKFSKDKAIKRPSNLTQDQWEAFIYPIVMDIQSNKYGERWLKRKDCKKINQLFKDEYNDNIQNYDDKFNDLIQDKLKNNTVFNQAYGSLK